MQSLRRQWLCAQQLWQSSAQLTWFLASYDVENAFTYVAHSEVLDATAFLVAHMDADQVWVTPLATATVRARGFPRACTEVARTGYLGIPRHEVQTLVTCCLQNCDFMLGNCVGKQIQGLPMGSPLGTAVCKAVLSFREHKWLTSKRWAT